MAKNRTQNTAPIAPTDAVIASMETEFGPHVEVVEPAPAPAPVKEGVCAYIRRKLVAGDFGTYKALANDAKTRFPGSAPTDKSVASLARDMRKAGKLDLRPRVVFVEGDGTEGQIDASEA